MTCFRLPDTYWFFNTGITPQKRKCHVCITDDGQFFLINTENRAMYDCVPIFAKHYPFLQGTDRFVSCSRLFKYTPPHGVADNQCPLRRKDVEAIRDKVENSKVLEQENIDKILRSLDSWLAAQSALSKEKS
jgi:hypothetical protein